MKKFCRSRQVVAAYHCLGMRKALAVFLVDQAALAVVALGTGAVGAQVEIDLLLPCDVLSPQSINKP